MDGLHDGSQGHKAIVVLGGVREIIAHPHFHEEPATPYWCRLNSLDPLLVAAVFDIAQERGLDTEPPDREMASRVWSISVFATETEFSELVNAAHGRRNAKLYEVPPSFRPAEQLGGLL